VTDIDPRLKGRNAKPLVYGVLLALLALLVGSLFMPVCEAIPRADVPRFEAVMTLEERAARGEGFQKKNGRWHQCKSRLARALFF
jgi:hypothetical protein